MKFQSDIDIDFADRTQILKVIPHTVASQRRDDQLTAHNTGVYVTDIPCDPLTGCASIDYETAEDRGYIKLDFLNVNLYQQIQNEQQLEQLMHAEPDWQRFNTDQEFFEQLIHVNNHWKVLKRMPEFVNNIPRLAMFLAIIRPAKRHLIGETWKTVSETVWEKTQEGYQFKKSHAVAYAHLVVVNMNLLTNLANESN